MKNRACYNDDESMKYNSCNYSITRNAVCQCVREKLFMFSQTERLTIKSQAPKQNFREKF